MFPFSNAPLKIALLLWPIHLYQLRPFIYIRNLSWSVDLQLLYYNGIEKFTKITVLTLSKLCELANYTILLQGGCNIQWILNCIFLKILQCSHPTAILRVLARLGLPLKISLLPKRTASVFHTNLDYCTEYVYLLRLKSSIQFRDKTKEFYKGK